eukprot:2640366-Amphidinium_carterae.1
MVCHSKLGPRYCYCLTHWEEDAERKKTIGNGTSAFLSETQGFKRHTKVETCSANDAILHTLLSTLRYDGAEEYWFAGTVRGG